MFWKASLEDLKRGYFEAEHHYICLLCGKYFEKGIVYPEDGVIYEASRYMRIHIETTHGSVFEYLLHLDKKLTGLTDHQKKLLTLFYQGKSDKEVQAAMGTGSTSTIRNQRFVLKEKERQARLFLAMMELLKGKDQYAPSFLHVHKTARMIDDRYNVTDQENAQILQRYFSDGAEGVLKSFSRKEKHRLVILRALTSRFEKERYYTEKEVNQILHVVYDDYVTLRRYLIEYGFLDRMTDGSQYWLK